MCVCRGVIQVVCFCLFICFYIQIQKNMNLKLYINKVNWILRKAYVIFTKYKENFSSVPEIMDFEWQMRTYAVSFKQNILILKTDHCSKHCTTSVMLFWHNVSSSGNVIVQKSTSISSSSLYLHTVYKHEHTCTQMLRETVPS